MRRLLIGLVVAAVTLSAPFGALAGNQEVAQQIADNLRQNGQLQDYRIGVKFQDGTAWIRGRVGDPNQMGNVLKVVFDTPGVKRIVNNLTIDRDDANSLAQADGAVTPERISQLGSGALSTLAQRVQTEAQQAASRAERVATSFTPAAARPASATSAPQPIPIAYAQEATPAPVGGMSGGPVPQYVAAVGGPAPARYDQPHLPSYAWPSYSAYPNYAALTYPKKYSPAAWPYIGPFYPYPQVPLGWRKVTLEWHDGWWQLDFDDGPRRNGFLSGLFRPCK
ncbi:MAG: BON domain-containing protein [Planctomycetota bacterium]|jgi:hypothetical protein